MLRQLVITFVLGCVLASPMSAQTSNTTETQGAAELSASGPQENVAAGNVLQRAPGTWVRAALARHSKLINERLNGPRYGQQPSAQTEAESTSQSTTSTGGSSGLGSLTDLLSLANQFGALGSSGGLSNLLGSLAGSLGSSGTGSAASSTSGGGTNYTLEDLLAMAQAYEATKGGTSRADTAAPSGTSGQNVKAGTSQTRNGYTFGGAIARLPKAEDRFQSSNQTTTTKQPSFATRWANAMLQTFFTALATGLQTTQFIEVIKDGLRPLILPPATDGDGAASGDGTGSGTGADTGAGTGTNSSGTGSGSDSSTGNSGGTGGGNASSPGGGIEDVLPPADDSNDGGSTI